MQSNPEDVNLLLIEKELRFLKNVEDIHDLHAWSLDGKFHMSFCNVVISNVIASETLALLKNQIREYTPKMRIDHATIEIELRS